MDNTNIINVWDKLKEEFNISQEDFEAMSDAQKKKFTDLVYEYIALKAANDPDLMEKLEKLTEMLNKDQQSS